MTSKLLKPVSLVQQTKNERLFSGVWIRWSALNAAERLVCAVIVLIPVWWAFGLIQHLLPLIGLGTAFYEWRRSGTLGLKRPSWLVIALFAYATYNYIGSFLLTFDAHPLAELPPDVTRAPTDLVELTLTTFFSLPYLVWYVQSNNVRVRLKVVAWACSVSVAQQLAVWLVVHFIFAHAYYNPPRTLLATLIGKDAVYERGSGEYNYMLLYWPTDKSIGGLPRYFSFLGTPESFALFGGVAGLLALDIKNRLWSLLLFAPSIFFIALSGTRTVWIGFALVLFLRFLFTTGNVGGSRLLLTLIAIVSFVTLSLPPVTNLVFNTYSNTATSIGDYRANSTAERSAGYEETLERILESNPANLLFGHEVEESNAAGGVDIGSHSYILGTLLYKGGLVATGLFMTFWVSLILWLYRTRIGRPATSFLIWPLVSITLVTGLLGILGPMAILLSMILRRPAMKSLMRNTS
jgi:hypothetical protein